MADLKTVEGRLRAYIKYKKMAIPAFCDTMGVSRQWISSMKKSMMPDKLESLALLYSDLDIQWLMTGIVTDYKKITFPDSLVDSSEPRLPLTVEDLYKKICEQKDKEIEYLKELVTEFGLAVRAKWVPEEKTDTG